MITVSWFSCGEHAVRICSSLSQPRQQQTLLLLPLVARTARRLPTLPPPPLAQVILMLFGGFYANTATIPAVLRWSAWGLWLGVLGWVGGGVGGLWKRPSTLCVHPAR